MPGLLNTGAQVKLLGTVKDDLSGIEESGFDAAQERPELFTNSNATVENVREKVRRTIAANLAFWDTIEKYRTNILDCSTNDEKVELEYQKGIQAGNNGKKKVMNYMGGRALLEGVSQWVIRDYVFGNNGLNWAISPYFQKYPLYCGPSAAGKVLYYYGLTRYPNIMNKIRCQALPPAIVYTPIFNNTINMVYDHNSFYNNGGSGTISFNFYLNNTTDFRIDSITEYFRFSDGQASVTSKNISRNTDGSWSLTYNVNAYFCSYNVSFNTAISRLNTVRNPGDLIITKNSSEIARMPIAYYITNIIQDGYQQLGWRLGIRRDTGGYYPSDDTTSWDNAVVYPGRLIDGMKWASDLALNYNYIEITPQLIGNNDITPYKTTLQQSIENGDPFFVARYGAVSYGQNFVTDAHWRIGLGYKDVYQNIQYSFLWWVWTVSELRSYLLMTDGNKAESYYMYRNYVNGQRQYISAELWWELMSQQDYNYQFIVYRNN